MNTLRPILLYYTILLFHTLLAPTSALPSGSIWVVNIENGPSPSPEDGPTFSKDAVRDPAYLPIQVGSIVGAYLIWIIFISIAVLTVGRRLRRQAQTSRKTTAMSTVHPNTQQMAMPAQNIDTKTASEGIWEITPISPTKDMPWSPKSWGSGKKHHHSTAVSVGTFDESVISEDRTRNEIEMDRLYAAVAAHEAARERRSPPPMPLSPLNQHPPEFQHLRYPGRSHHDVGLLPSPPPEDDVERSQTSPIGTPVSKRGKKPTPLSFNDPQSRGSSRSSFSSWASFGKKKSSSVRGLPISPPMGSPEITTDSRYLDSEPLTPRHYKPGPPPPTPPSQRYYPQEEPIASPVPIDEDGRKYFFSPTIRSSRGSMSTMGYTPGATPRTATFPVYPPPTVQEEQTRSNLISITIDPSSAAPTPRAVPSTPLPPPPQGEATIQNYSVPRIASIPPRSATGSIDSSKRHKPAPLALGTSTANNSQATLPLRTAPLPLRALRSPNSTRPVSTIKNTELSRPEGKAGGLRVPGTAGMVPATPYSPFYQPMTPLTPMTPSRLVTREERKRTKKEEGRRALTQDDMVVDEEDMWGEGY